MDNVKRKKVIIILCLLVLISFFLSDYGLSFAKYATNSVWNYYLKSKGFYFTSDYLDTSSIKNVNNLWDGSSIYFNVKNYVNQSVITGYDINYETSCTIEGESSNYASCTINGTNTNSITRTLLANYRCINNTDDLVDVSSYDEATCLAGLYDWTNRPSSSELYFDVVLNDNNYVLNDVIVNITVTSLSPYHKVLAGQFILHKNTSGSSTLFREYIDENSYGRLTISNVSDSVKNVKISFDSNKLRIDTNNVFNSMVNDDNGYIKQVVVSIPSNNSSSLIFYKISQEVYTISNFTIQEMS